MFEELKRYLLSPPLPSKPMEGETLMLYLLASHQAIRSVLVWEEEGVQIPVYYVGQELKDAETRYIPLEKVVYALVITG